MSFITGQVVRKCNVNHHNFSLRSYAEHTFQGRLIPLKKSGIHNGKTTASFSSFLASVSSAMSSLQNRNNKSGNLIYQ